VFDIADTAGPPCSTAVKVEQYINMDIAVTVELIAITSITRQVCWQSVCVWCAHDVVYCTTSENASISWKNRCNPTYQFTLFLPFTDIAVL